MALPGMLGRLKALGDKVGTGIDGLGGAVGRGIGVVGSGVLTVADKVGTGVGTGIGAVGTGFRDIKDSLLDSDLDRIRSVHAFQKSQVEQQPRGRKQLSEKELDEADRKADAVLSQLPPGYFDKEYDPVRHQLMQLTEGSGQDDMDAEVERLGTCVEAVSGKLSRHVVKKSAQLLEGINVVATVEDDLKAALATARTARDTVRQSGLEVERHLRVVGQTRRKQSYMQVMEVVAKVQQARNLQKLLRRAQENGEYREAILLCVQCFQNVESLMELKVSAELLATVQRLYVDTLQKLDGALTAICREFDAVRYTKVLDGYLLQGVSGATLAERVLQCFKDAIYDSTSRVIKSLLLTQTQLVNQLQRGQTMLEGSFASLCAALPPGLVGPCLAQVLEVVLQVLASFHAMTQWHGEALKQQQVQQQQRQEAVTAGEEIEAGARAAAADAATLDFLTSVSHMLAGAKAEVFASAASRVLLLINVPAATGGKPLLQVAGRCDRFMALGEAFCGVPQLELRARMGGALATAFESLHHSNMEALSALLHQESAWRNVGGPDGASTTTEGKVIYLAEAISPPQAPTAAPRDFGTWLGEAKEISPFGNDLVLFQPSVVGAPGVMITTSGQHMLRCIRAYCQLLGPLGATRAGAVWQALTQLFDRFMTATFMLLSGVAVETLVLQDDLVTLRLRSALLRILSAEGSRYKPEIEELLKLRATQAGQRAQSTSQSGSGTGISWLDRFGDKMESLAHDLDRGMTKMQAALGDNVKIPSALANLTVDGSGASSTSASTFLQDRVVAAEALVVVAGELRAGRTFLLPVLQAAARTAPTPIAAHPRLQYDGMQPQPAGRLQYEGMAAPTPARLQYAGMLAAASVPRSPGGTTLSSGAPTSPVEESEAVWRPPPMAVTTSTLPREADTYFARVIEAAWDLKECLLQGSTRALLGRLLDPERGMVPQVAATPCYSGREPAIRENPWAEAAVLGLHQFGEQLSKREEALPPHALDQMWLSAVLLVVEAMTLGFSHVRRCTLEGRAAMSNDVSYVGKAVRQLAPPSVCEPALASLRRADDYVRAYYLPWDELTRFCQLQFCAFGLVRLIPLVELAAEVHKIRRAEKQQLIELLEGMALDYMV